MNAREAALKQAGLSEPVVDLAMGRHPHDLFFFRCQEPPDLEGALPLWQCEGWVTAFHGGEFVGMDPKDPEARQVIARTEQGLLANLFSDLVEDEDWEEEEEEAMAALREAAEEVGFQHLDDLLAFQERHAEDEDYAETLAEWTRRI